MIPSLIFPFYSWCIKKKFWSSLIQFSISRMHLFSSDLKEKKRKSKKKKKSALSFRHWQMDLAIIFLD